jgi:hypothetical protein
VGDYRGWSPLNDVNWDVECSRQCLDLTLAQSTPLHSFSRDVVGTKKGGLERVGKER